MKRLWTKFWVNIFNGECFIKKMDAKIVAAEIMTRQFDYLDGPVVCVASEDVPNPVSKVKNI